MSNINSKVARPLTVFMDSSILVAFRVTPVKPNAPMIIKIKPRIKGSVRMSIISTILSIPKEQ